MAEAGVNVANLIATLKLDLSQFQTAVQQLDQNLGKIQTAAGQTGAATGELATKTSLAESAVKSLGLQGTILGQALTFLLHPLTLVGGALLALEEASRRSLEAMVAHAREIEYMSAVSGAGAERANALVEGLKLMGADSESAALAMFRMSAEIESGGAGLARLGIALRDSHGNLKTEIEYFLEAHARISELGTAQERAAALTDLYGLAGRRLAAVHNENAAALRGFMQEGARVRPWAEETQAQSMALIQANQKLTESWSGLSTELAKLMAGPAAAFKNWLADIVAGAREAASGLRQFLGGTGAFALTETGAGAPLPGAAGGTEAGGGAPGPTRRTPADYMALEADLARRLQANQQYYDRLEGLRAVDVARDRTDRASQLQGLLADLQARMAAETAYFNRREALVREQFKDLSNPAAQLAMTELQAQKEAALASLRVQSLHTQAQLEADLTRQRNQAREQEVAGWVAFAEEVERTDALIAKDELDLAAEVKRMMDEMRASDVARAQAVIDETEAESKALTEVRSRFGELTKDAEAFRRQVEAVTTQAGVFRGAGVQGVDLTGQLQSMTQARITSLLQQSQEWRDAIKNVEQGTDAFNELQGHIAEADRQLNVLTTDLGKLQQLNTLKSITTDVFGALNRAITTSITGIIQGTTTASKAFENMGQSILLSIEEIVIKRAFKEMEEAFFSMLDSMIKAAAESGLWQAIISAVGGAVGGYAGGGVTGGSTEIGGITQQGAGVGQAGGIVTRPTWALIGERHPEALIPLDRMPGASPLPAFGDGGGLTVVVNNYSQADVSAKQSVSPDGRRQLEVLVQDTVRKGVVDGSFDRAFQSTYGLSRQGTRR